MTNPIVAGFSGLPGKHPIRPGSAIRLGTAMSDVVHA
jgi:hypothetical protein